MCIRGKNLFFYDASAIAARHRDFETLNNVTGLLTDSHSLCPCVCVVNLLLTLDVVSQTKSSIGTIVGL